jgi:hypothetical protein
VIWTAFLDFSRQAVSANSALQQVFPAVSQASAVINVMQDFSLMCVMHQL